MAEYNVGYLKDEKNQIFIPYTYTKSVKIDDKGTMLDSEFNKALNNISTNKNNIDNLATTSAATYETKTDASNKLNEAKKYADKKVADLVNGAPEKLDTLEELASALGDDANFASTVVDLISTKADKAIKIIAGKGLTGGGTLSDSRTIDVGVGSGLIVTDNAIAHSNSIKAGKVSGTATQQLGFAGSFNIPTVEYDSEGHITKTSITTITLPNDAQIVANANGITDLGTRVTNEVKTLNNTINSTKTELEGKITKAQNDAATGLNNLQTSINNTLDGFSDTLSTHSDEIDDTKDRVADLETKTSIIQTLTDGTGDSAFQITDKNGNIGFQVSDGNTYSYDFILAKNGESEISLREFNADISNRMQAAENGIANRKTIQSAVSDPSVTNSTSDSFISNISQNTNGVITATKKKAILNTAGSTDTSSKIFLIGATSQAANPQTYSHNTAYVNTNGHLYSNSKQVVNLSDSQALTNKTYNGYTLADACAKGVTDSTAAGAIGTGTNLVTERDVYYGLPTINNSHAYTSSTTIYAPTSSGTKGYILKANGGTSAPTWVAQSTLEVGKATEAGTATYAGQLTTAKKINGTAFNGSADIITANWGTTRKINITNSDGTNGSTTVDVNGSADVSLKLPTTIKATLDGNAETANKLKTAVALKVGNTSKNFDGSAELTWTHQEIGYANSISSGLLSAAAQTISGEKTFVNNVNVNGTLYPKKISVEETAWINDLIIENSVEVLGNTKFWSDIRCGAGPYNKGTFGYGKALIFFDQNGFNTENSLGMFQCYQSSLTSASEVWMKAMKPVANSTDWTGIYVYYYADGTTKSGSNAKFYGAVWNDYAEFRQFKDGEEIPYGRIVIENGDDSLSLSNDRLQKGGNVCSDTFGFAIGETEKTKMPIAVAGRALVYTYEDRNSYAPGDAVCSGPNGTISKMTREEIKEYPDCIIGYVSAIPDYEIWGEHNTIVDGRIWIKVV